MIAVTREIHANCRIVIIVVAHYTLGTCRTKQVFAIVMVFESLRKGRLRAQHSNETLTYKSPEKSKRDNVRSKLSDDGFGLLADGESYHDPDRYDRSIQTRCPKVTSPRHFTSNKSNAMKQKQSMDFEKIHEINNKVAGYERYAPSGINTGNKTCRNEALSRSATKHNWHDQKKSIDDDWKHHPSPVRNESFDENFRKTQSSPTKGIKKRVEQRKPSKEEWHSTSRPIGAERFGESFRIEQYSPTKGTKRHITRKSSTNVGCAQFDARCSVKQDSDTSSYRRNIGTDEERRHECRTPIHSNENARKMKQDAPITTNWNDENTRQKKSVAIKPKKIAIHSESPFISPKPSATQLPYRQTPSSLPLTSPQGSCAQPSRQHNQYLTLALQGDSWGRLTGAPSKEVKSPDRHSRTSNTNHRANDYEGDDNSVSSHLENDEMRNNYSIDNSVPIEVLSDSDDESSEGRSDSLITDDDEPFEVQRKIARMSSGQLRRFDGFRAQVVELVKQAMPQKINQVPELMQQFAGREAELIQTLQTMCTRPRQSSTYVSNGRSVVKSRGAIAKLDEASTRRTHTISGRKIDAIASIAIASTIDDQMQALKAEYAVDDNYNRDHDRYRDYDDDEGSSTEQDDEDSQQSYDDEENADDDNDYDDYEDDDDEGDDNYIDDEKDERENSYYSNNESYEGSAFSMEYDGNESGCCRQTRVPVSSPRRGNGGGSQTVSRSDDEYIEGDYCGGKKQVSLSRPPTRNVPRQNSDVDTYDSDDRRGVDRRTRKQSYDSQISHDHDPYYSEDDCELDNQSSRDHRHQARSYPVPALSPGRRSFRSYGGRDEEGNKDDSGYLQNERRRQHQSERNDIHRMRNRVNSHDNYDDDHDEGGENSYIEPRTRKIRPSENSNKPRSRNMRYSGNNLHQDSYSDGMHIDRNRKSSDHKNSDDRNGGPRPILKQNGRREGKRKPSSHDWSFISGMSFR